MLKSFYIQFSLCLISLVPQAQDSTYLSQDSAIVSGSDFDTRTGPGLVLPLKRDTSLYYELFNVSPDTILLWKKQRAFEYAAYLDSLLRDKQNKSKEALARARPSSGPGWMDNVLNSAATKVFFWSLAVIFILYILYKLFLTEGIFRKTATGNENVVEVKGEASFNLKSDFDEYINNAVLNSNFRLAVRYHYLKTLHKLAVYHFIELAADKTNDQYVKEIMHSGHRKIFASLTLRYEYVWYGEWDIDEVIYNRIAPEFSGFHQILPTRN